MITSWNSGADKTFGHTAQEAIGQSIMMLIPEERRDEELQMLDRIHRGESVQHFETVWIGKRGELTTCRSRCRRCTTQPAELWAGPVEGRPQY